MNKEKALERAKWIISQAKRLKSELRDGEMEIMITAAIMEASLDARQKGRGEGIDMAIRKINSMKNNN